MAEINLQFGDVKYLCDFIQTMGWGALYSNGILSVKTCIQFSKTSTRMD